MATTVTSGLVEIKEIEKEIEGLQADAAEARALVEKADAAIAEKYANLRDVADSLSGDFKLNGSSPPTSAVKKRGRSPGPMNIAVKKKRGRPRGSKNVAVKKKSGKKTTAKSSPMLRSCLVILGDKRKWRKHNPELPAGSEGLSVVELRRTIKGNEMWPEEGGTEAFKEAIETLTNSGKVERIEKARIKLMK